MQYQFGQKTLPNNGKELSILIKQYGEFFVGESFDKGRI